MAEFLQLADGFLGEVYVLARGQLEAFDPEAKEAAWQRFGDLAFAAVLVDVKIIKVVSVIDDQEVFFLVILFGFFVEAGAATDHLPELHLAEDGLGKDQGADGWDIDASIEHVDGNGYPGHVFVFEVI